MAGHFKAIFNPKQIVELLPPDGGKPRKVGIMLKKIRGGENPPAVWGVFLTDTATQTVLVECCATTDQEWGKVVASSLAAYIENEAAEMLNNVIGAALAVPPTNKRH